MSANTISAEGSLQQRLSYCERPPQFKIHAPHQNAVRQPAGRLMQSYDVQLAELESVALAVVRRQVSRAQLGAAVRDGCGRAFAFARRHGLQAGCNVAVYWDGSIRLDAGVEVPATFVEGEGIVRSATPAGLTAFVAHVGPYEQLGAAHAAIRAWCSARGCRLVGPNWEIYGHWQPEWNTDASRIRTDIFYQVARDSGSAG